MALENLDTEIEVEEDEVDEADDPEEETDEEPKYTQAQVNRIVEERLARERRKAATGSRIKTLRTERDTARKTLEEREAELEGLKREHILISLGVDPEDAEYYAYSIGKEVDEDHTFEDLAKERAKAGKFSRYVSTGASVAERGGTDKKTPSDEMNALIRRAKK